ncbi:MAG: nuclear transport factor 2 family protein [Solirubrobacterales bacterium]
MSEENVEIVRRAAKALASRDRTTWLAVNAPELELVPLADWPDPGALGPAAIWDFYLDVFDILGPLAADNAEVIDAGGDKVLMRYRSDASGRSSGAAVEFDYSAVLTVRQGKVHRIQWFADHTEALEAAGLSE